jgi:hypothetical protein
MCGKQCEMQTWFQKWIKKCIALHNCNCNCNMLNMSTKTSPVITSLSYSKKILCWTLATFSFWEIQGWISSHILARFCPSMPQKTVFLEITSMFLAESFSEPPWLNGLNTWQLNQRQGFNPCCMLFFSSATFYGKKSRSKLGSDRSKCREPT